MIQEKRSLRRALLCLMAGIVCVMLVACETIRLDPITAQRTLTGQEGAVVVKVIANSLAAGDPGEALDALNLERVLAPGEHSTGREHVTLLRTRQATYSTAVFSGIVPPGRYVIRTATGGQGAWNFTYPIGTKLGSFEVTKGGTTLLGTLLIQALDNRRFALAYLPPEQELQQTFESLYPALAAQPRSRDAPGFLPSAELDRGVALAGAVKQQPSAWSGIAQTADGEFMAGGKLGKVMWHKAGDTQWRELDVGTWREVMGARPFQGGILAFGEEGLLRLSIDDGRTWERLVPPDTGLLLAVQPLSDGAVVAWSRTDQIWSAYRSEDVRSGKWQKLGEAADAQSINLRWKRPIGVSLPDAAGVMLPNGDFFLTDGKTLTRSSTGRSLLDVNVQSKGIIAARTTLLTETVLVSSDKGKTWKDLNANRFAVAIALRDAETAYAVSAIDPKIFSGPLGLMTTHDGGKRWIHTGKSPGLNSPFAVQQMMVDRSDGSLLAFLPSNAVSRSRDEGRTWTSVK